jgi:hypothetical protein
LRNCQPRSTSEKSWSTVSADAVEETKSLNQAGFDSVPPLTALSSNAFRNSCWCFSRVKSPSVYW